MMRLLCDSLWQYPTTRLGTMRPGRAACLALATLAVLSVGCSPRPAAGPSASAGPTAPATPAEVVGAFLEDLRAERIDAAQRLCSRRRGARFPKERLAALVANLPVLREHTAVTITHVSGGAPPVGVSVELSAPSGNEPIRFYLNQEAGVWKIDAMHFEMFDTFPNAPDNGGLRMFDSETICYDMPAGARHNVRCQTMVIALRDPSDEPRMCQFEVDWELTDPFGERVEKLSRRRTESSPVSCSKEPWPATFALSLASDDPPGPYTLRVRVTDTLTGATLARELADFVHQ